MNDDVFDALARLNPLPQLEETLPGDDALLRGIIAGASVIPARRRRQRVVRIAAAGVGLAAIGLAAFSLLRQSPATNGQQIVCYSEAATEPAVRVVISGTDDPIAHCTEVWITGELSGGGTVPPLTACVDTHGNVAVLPGEQQVCNSLGLANWQGGLPKNRDQVAQLTDLVNAYFGGQCHTLAEAQAVLPGMLAEAGLPDWEIRDNHQVDEAHPCAVAAVDPEFENVVILALPDIAGGTDTSPTSP